MSTPFILRSRSLLFSILGFLVLGAAAFGLILRFSGSVAAAPHAPAAPGKPAAMPASSDIEAQWGIRPVMLALTAGTGMVDFRYEVLDPAKAGNMHGSLNTTPYFISADGKTVKLTELMGGHSNFETGRTYYILYPNVGNAIKAGTEVTMVIGSLKLEHIPVR